MLLLMMIAGLRCQNFENGTWWTSTSTMATEVHRGSKINNTYLLSMDLLIICIRYICNGMLKSVLLDPLWRSCAPGEHDEKMSQVTVLCSHRKVCDV